ncbi:MAG: DUF418 domain-containing protein [Kangiellaceae bacterium]|jgi:uncharacterized protein|nr:DUF418 domain-containing protein [Kangiellaceae bacterium]
MDPTIQKQTRIDVLDLIRGVAVLGILAMNIQAFSMPFAAYSNPTVYGDLTGINLLTWQIQHLVFDQKFMSIFSILFGVGVMIFIDNVAKREVNPAVRHYSRMLWLLLFGAIHAFLIWWGDILMLYSVSGMLLYNFKDAKNKTLVIWIIALLAILSLVQLSQGFAFQVMTEEEIQKDILPFWDPAKEVITAEIIAYNGSWLDAFNQRTQQTAILQPYLLFTLPKILALNLIGVLMYRTGFITGRFNNSQYIGLGLLLIVMGSYLTFTGMTNNLAVDFDYTYSMAFGIQYNYWGSLLVACGYISLLMLFARNVTNILITRWLANVGKMAFTNYIAESLICTFIIYGHGLALFGELERYQQGLFVLAVWLLLIVTTNLWLQRYQQGPLEWLWRSLTYQSIVPIKKQVTK